MHHAISSLIALVVLVAAVGAGRADDARVTKADYFAALSEEKLDKINELIASGDKEAVRRYMAENRDVFITKAGVKVHIVKTRLTGKVRVRVKGDTLEFWTVIEAVR